MLLNRTALITNWATFYSDLVLQTDLPENKICKYIPKLHLPIMESDGIITSVWNNGIIFRHRAGELAILMITRRFDSDELIQLKAQGGSNVPMGARIV